MWYMSDKTNYKPKPKVKTEDKLLWSIREASAYSGISEPRLRGLAKEPDCSFSLRVGRRISIKKKEFMEFLSSVKEI